MSSGVTCTVTVDGVRLPDGSIGDSDLDPVALSGLSTTWGRSTTMDQPAAATCTLQVLDVPAGRVFVDTIRVGSALRVTATGADWPDPDQPAFSDGGFEAGTASWSTSGATAQRVSHRAASGATSLRVDPVDDTWTLDLHPAPPAAPGTHPDAWDELPTTTRGQRWQVDVEVWVPAGITITATPLTYTAPYADAGTPAGATSTLTGTWAGWQHLTVELRPALDGAWVGLRLVGEHTGLAWSDVDPAWTWSTIPADLTWADLGSVYVDDVVVLAPADGLRRETLVFAGRVTDLEAAPTPAGDGLVTITAVDFTADLESRVVGDEPWTVEPLAARARRILDLAGLPITLDVDDTLAPTRVSWRDVDAQGAAGLLAELAQSVDGVLWSATHRVAGPRLRLEDIYTRAALRQITPPLGYSAAWARTPHDSASILVSVVPSPSAHAIALSACDVLRDPVRWVQSVADILTRAAVTWREQGVDDEGRPTTTDRTYTLVDVDLEAQLGTRGASVSTQLQAQDDAATVARRLLERTNVVDWRAQGLVVDEAGLTEAGAPMVLDLLDGAARIGAGILLTDLPPSSWAPVTGSVPVYLEGGTYSFVDGAWVLELTVSSSTGQGQSARWRELDRAWTWDRTDPALTWSDLRGAAAPTPVEAP